MSVVRIKTPEKLSTGVGTVIETADGARVHGVRRATIRIEPGEVITADLEVCAVWTGGLAKARYLVIHPETGKPTAVSRIVFADGTVFVPGTK